MQGRLEEEQEARGQLLPGRLADKTIPMNKLHNLLPIQHPQRDRSLMENAAPLVPAWLNVAAELAGSRRDRIVLLLLAAPLPLSTLL